MSVGYKRGPNPTSSKHTSLLITTMQLKSIVFFATQIVAILGLAVIGGRDGPGSVHTALKIYHTIIKESPFLVDRTLRFEGTSITTSRPTAAPTPTIGY
ncbi:hypothetical protein BJ912DRAFT_974987 [Pholiota molesta]|nr:hypothetical protein BJ912DRAFT_974987 [Pholiota molesta]